jgi:hypothetical protein
MDTGTGLLLDFSDEQLVQVPSALLRKAEVDDTFGIFGSNPKPRCSSTPCGAGAGALLRKPFKPSPLESPSFLGLNEGFLCGSSSVSALADFSASTNKSSTGSGGCPANGDKIGSTEGQEQESKGDDMPGIRSSRSMTSTTLSENQTEGEELDTSSVFASPIIKLEGGSDHEDKHSPYDNDHFLSCSTDSGEYCLGISKLLLSLVYK